MSEQQRHDSAQTSYVRKHKQTAANGGRRDARLEILEQLELRRVGVDDDDAPQRLLDGDIDILARRERSFATGEQVKL